MAINQSELFKGQIVKHLVERTVFTTMQEFSKDGTILSSTSKNTGLKVWEVEGVYEILGQRKLKRGVRYNLKDLENGSKSNSYLIDGSDNGRKWKYELVTIEGLQ